MKNSNFIVNVEGAVFRRDKWLIIKRSEKEEYAPGTLALVGGKLELPEEDGFEDIAEETLRREIEEEVGIKVEERMDYLESKVFFTDDGQPVFDLVFLCRHKSGEAYPRDLEEVEEVFWQTAKCILENSRAPEYLKRSLSKAEKMKRKMEPWGEG